MGAPYSLDLRKRVVGAIKGGMSRNKAAKQFGVAISTAINWARLEEETGSIEPGQMGGHKPKAISGEHAVWLRQRIRANDFTLRGLVAELAERGLKVDYRSVWNLFMPRSSALKKSVEAGERDRPDVARRRGNGGNIKIASTLRVLSSSTKPGPGQIWRRCGAGAPAGAG